MVYRCTGTKQLLTRKKNHATWAAACTCHLSTIHHKHTGKHETAQAGGQKNTVIIQAHKSTDRNKNNRVLNCKYSERTSKFVDPALLFLLPRGLPELVALQVRLSQQGRQIHGVPVIRKKKKKKKEMTMGKKVGQPYTCNKCISEHDQD